MNSGENPMRIFVTGASGFIGTEVARELKSAGHNVVGLARSDASATKLLDAGYEVLRGSLDDHDVLRQGAKNADGVINLAFDNFGMRTDFMESVRQDQAAVEAMIEVLEGTNKPFVNTSGTLLLSFLGRLGTEADVLDSSFPRVGTENFVIDSAQRAVRSSTVRLAPSVHGEGDLHGFVPGLITIARAKGVSGYVGDGMNRWPGVHVLDAARLYRLAVESAPAGSRLHGVGDQGVAFKEIAEAIGRNLDVPVVSIAGEDAPDHFSYLAMFVPWDNPASNATTRELLKWEPTHAGLIEDIDKGFYFTTPLS
jgi:nucleoside-diphosphate-sugar epimerase